MTTTRAFVDADRLFATRCFIPAFGPPIARSSEKIATSGVIC
jgi:hypothetical protein